MSKLWSPRVALCATFLALLGGCAAPEPDDDQAQTAAESEDALTTESGVDDPREIRVSGDRLFWKTPEGLFSRAKRSSGWGWGWGSTGAKTRILQGKLGGGAFDGATYAIDGGTIYAIVSKTLLTVPVAGGTQTPYPFPLTDAEHVVVDQDNVFVAGRDGVYRLPKDFSAAPTTLAPVACTGPGSGTRDLVQDATAVFVVACHDRVLRVPKTGGAAQPIITGGIRTIATSDATLYSIEGSALVARPSAGGAPTVLLAETDASSVTVAGQDVLLSSIFRISRFDPATKQVKELRTFGKTVGVVPWATQTGALQGVALDGDRFYYAEGNTRPISGPWPTDETPRTGKLGYELLR